MTEASSCISASLLVAHILFVDRAAWPCHIMHDTSANLASLSHRLPVLEAGFHKYSAAGDPAAILCGDFFASKGKSGCMSLGPIVSRGTYPQKLCGCLWRHAGCCEWVNKWQKEVVAILGSGRDHGHVCNMWGNQAPHTSLCATPRMQAWAGCGWLRPRVPWLCSTPTCMPTTATSMRRHRQGPAPMRAGAQPALRAWGTQRPAAPAGSRCPGMGTLLSGSPRSLSCHR